MRGDFDDLHPHFLRELIRDVGGRSEFCEDRLHTLRLSESLQFGEILRRRLGSGGKAGDDRPDDLAAVASPEVTEGVVPRDDDTRLECRDALFDGVVQFTQ